MQTRIWVPILGNDLTGYKPDIPDEIAWDANDGIPLDFVSKNKRHAVSQYCVTVDASDLSAIETHLAEKGMGYQHFDDGDASDILMVNMIRACAVNPNAKIEGFFDTIPEAKTTTQKRTRKDVLLQAVARGLDSGKGEAIREKHNLPQSAKTTGTIDDEILEAKYAYGKRTYTAAQLETEIARDVKRGAMSAERGENMKSNLRSQDNESRGLGGR